MGNMFKYHQQQKTKIKLLYVKYKLYLKIYGLINYIINFFNLNILFKIYWLIIIFIIDTKRNN